MALYPGPTGEVTETIASVSSVVGVGVGVGIGVGVSAGVGVGLTGKVLGAVGVGDGFSTAGVGADGAQAPSKSVPITRTVNIDLRTLSIPDRV